MKKWLLISTAVISLFLSCSHPAGSNPQQRHTAIVFDNTHGICAASVYNDYLSREQKLESNRFALIPAGKKSDEIEWTSNDLEPTFFFSYTINLIGINGFSLDYIPKVKGKNQATLRIDEGETMTFTIPRLDETISSPDELFSDKSYLLIQNNSSFPFRLLRGASEIKKPDNLSAEIVNPDERAQYTINPGSASPYQLLVSGDYKAFSGSIVSFEAGRVYSFVFDGAVSLVSEVEIKLDNVADSSLNNSGPETPGAPIVTASDGLLTLRWTAVQGADSYEVYISTTQEPPALPKKTVAGITTVLTELTNKTAYYIWIKAVNSSDKSGFSPCVRGIPWPDNEKPATPEGLVIIPGINQLTVNWEECGGATSYEVYINATTPSSPSTPEKTTEKTSAVINNLENDITYYIWVKALNNAGKSSYSQPESGTPTIPTRAPSAPARPVLTAGNHKLTVSWQAVELAASYEVWIGTAENSALAQKKGGDIANGVTETVISGLENETVYYVWIKAKNVVGTSGFSPFANAKPSAFAVLPETPSVPTVTVGNRELSVTWPPVEGALSYEVWTGTTNNSASAQKNGADVSGASVTLTGLANGTTYYIWIKAKNNIGVSDLSPRASGTPSAFAAVPSAPQAAPILIAGSGQLTASWQAAEGASAYEVWAGTDTNPTLATKRGGDVTGLSSVITGLTNGTTYYVWIKAKNTVGTSGFSPMATGTPSVFTVTPQAPTAPSISIGNGLINITWQAVEGATAYEVWTGTSNSSASASKNGTDVSASLSVTIESLNNGTTYYVWIKAKNNVGASGFSPVASGKPIANAAAPTLSASNTQISATWVAIAGADQYDVFCGTGINPPQSATQTVTGTSVTISSLVNGTTYNMWVRGKNSTGTGAMSTAANAKPVGNMGTVTIASGNGQLTANWSAVAGADQYEVYYSTTSAMPGSPSQTISVTTVTISSLTNGTTYYMWVKPKNANGAGTVNTSVSGTPMATPGSLTVSAGNQQITVSWAAVPGASSYEFYYGTTTTIPSTASFSNVTELSKTITGLTNGTTYNFWVKAVNANGTSAASPMASGKPIGNMGTVTLTTGGSGELVLSWSAVAGADQYEVYHNTNNSIPSSSSLTVSATTATISGLTNGTMYYVWVKGKNANGTNNASTAVSGKPLGTPGAPTLSPAFKQLLVTWTAVPGADGYEVYYGTSSTPTTLAAITAGTTATITGLTNGTTYYVRLRAKNANGVSGYGVNANQAPGLSPGLYRGADKIGTQNLAASITYISTNAVNGDDFYIVLGADESSPPQTLSYSNKTVGITLLGYNSERKITLNANGSLFSINSGVTLTLDENITLVGRSANNASLVYLSNNSISKLIMNEGARISGNFASGDLASGYGGGVYVASGTFTMNGGEISGNIAVSVGGGVFVGSSGTFTMSGGKISGNTASRNGGGVLISSSGTFTMSGGEISGNTAFDSSGGYGDGGGVYVGSGTFTMSGGRIYGNTASGNTSPGNFASGYGGGVYVASGTFTMSGGEISGNIAVFAGGGVFVDSSGTFTKLGGGTITGYASDTVNGNVVKERSGVVRNNYGHAVYYFGQRRETTAGPTVNLDSSKSGSAGGWE
jgi:hypothetical protein